MDFYTDQGSGGIDLREEFSTVLDGSVDFVAQGRQVVLRRLTNINCVCWDETTGGCKGDCPYCQQEGWQFSETMEDMYIAMGVAPVYKPGFLANGMYPQTEMGFVDPNRATGYCRYSVFPDYEKYSDNSKKNFDKLYELKVTDTGDTFYPLTRVAKWKILTVTPLHGDFGRVEFFELSMSKANF